jgi:hypothetical protein
MTVEPESKRTHITFVNNIRRHGNIFDAQRFLIEFTNDYVKHLFSTEGRSLTHA